MKQYAYALIATLLTGAAAHAATSIPAPKITVISDSKFGGAVSNLSDNGEWIVGAGMSQFMTTPTSYPCIYNLNTAQLISLFDDTNVAVPPALEATDVSDDGSVVVGAYDGKPAVWKKSTGKWTVAENKHSYKNGSIAHVTPDGKFGIGTLYTGEGMKATMRLWDLSGNVAKDITPDNMPKPIGPNLTPTTGALDNLVQQIYAGDISADGTLFTGVVNYSYPQDCWTFVYDLTTRTWHGVAMEVTDNGDTYTFNRNEPGVMTIESATFVGPTHTLCGDMTSYNDDSSIFYYDCDTKTLSGLGNSGGYGFGMADPAGTVYASKTYEGPMRDWMFLTDGYWYDFAVVAKQLWDIDWTEQYSVDNLGLTGTLTAVADDGKTILAMDYSVTPYTAFVVQFDQPLPEIVKDFNMLGNYYTTPVNNSSFAIMRETKVTFDREIEIVGNYNAATLKDENGAVVANSVSLQTDPGNPRTVAALFRNYRLEEGKPYTVTIPAGVVAVAGDKTRTNEEISVCYKGRPNAPVAPVVISPAEGSEVSRINANSNPVTIRFNSEIASVTGNTNPMTLYLLDDEGKREQVAVLAGSITSDVLSIYPVLEQRLAYGSKYQIVIPAGSVADLSGADPNDEIVINYTGSYLPGGPGTDGVLFEDNFDQGLTNKWMFYDGAADLEPSDLMTSWGFSQGMPWWTVMDNEMSDSQSAVSHSMFKSPGKADSWMVTPILNISDKSAKLSFKSQCYRDVQDVVKVYVYVTDDIYTSLTPSIVDNFRYYGEVIYEEAQSPGENEELLEGEWKENSIPLDKFAGKNIYVAFVNDNRNKSAIFIDDVKVAIDLKFALINTTPLSVVNKDEAEISASLQVVGDGEKYRGYTVTLKDAEGNEVSSLADPDAVAEKGWRLDFKFPETLPITVGKENKYSIDVKLGNESSSLTASILDLAMETSKKVVIEEFTGQGCQFCPLGHAAIDWIQKDFPGLVLPVELHSYTGDNFNNEKVQSLTVNLGMQAAPTARINRGTEILSPMVTDENRNYVYKNANVWYDHVVAELENLAPADIEVTSVVFDGNDCVADITVTYALDMDNVNLNMLLELCEDNVMGLQSNGVAADQPALGEWGANGIYNQSTNLYFYHNVLRNWEGQTFNGTGGLLPNSIKAGVPYTVTMKVAAPKAIGDIDKTHVTAMLIDSESGKILNADRRFTNTRSAVDTFDAARYTFAASDASIRVSYPGAITVDLYSLDGTHLATAAGVDEAHLDTYGLAGIVIATVRTADGMRHHKIHL